MLDKTDYLIVADYYFDYWEVDSMSKAGSKVVNKKMKQQFSQHGKDRFAACSPGLEEHTNGCHGYESSPTINVTPNTDCSSPAKGAHETTGGQQSSQKILRKTRRGKGVL